MLEKIKSYFRGYAMSGRQIFAKRKYLAEQFGIKVRTLTRYLAYLGIDFLKTVKRTARTAYRQVVENRVAGPSAGPSIEVNPEVSVIVLSTSTETVRNDVEPVAELEQIRKAAGMDRLSEPDKRFVQELERRGTPKEAIKAGILLGRARKMCSDVNRGLRDPIRSLRYFADTIREAGGMSKSYLDYVANFVERHTQ